MHQRLDEGSTARYEDIVIWLLFQLGDFFNDIFFDNC